MKKPNLSSFVRNTQRTLSKHSPEILTFLGITGMVTTTVLAVKATPKAMRLIDEEKNRKNYELSKEARDNGFKECEEIDHLGVMDTVKTTWKCYLPAAITGVASIACLIGASSVNARRTAALATAYKLSESALKEYKDAVVETIGEKKEKAVRDKVAEERIKKNPIDTSDIVITNKGTTLCFDTLSGQYFRSDMDVIKKAENDINKVMLNEMYVSLNRLYTALGLRTTSLGDDLGWNIDDGYLEIYFSSQLAEDGTPCLVLDYKVAPKYDYDKLVY